MGAMVAESVAQGQVVEVDKPVLQLVDLHKTYERDGLEAVAGVDLEVRAGEILTILGPSGCGKTTTLRMVMGLETVTSGTIIYDGRVLEGGDRRRPVPIHKRRMGMVFQSYAIWPHMTVGENISYPLRIRRDKPSRSEIQDAVKRVLGLVGMDGLQDRPATMLSGGQQQRVALGRALVGEPKLLLLDEPFSNLDARLREEMRNELKLLQRRLGVTVLFVTHDQFEALSLSDQLAVMSTGKVEQVGTPEEIFERPATTMVRDFIGRSNVLTGTIEGDDGAWCTVRLDAEFGGSKVVAHSRGAPVPTGPCEVSIRFDDVRIEPATSDVGPNVLTGTVRGMLFGGGHYETIVDLAAGARVVAFLPRGHGLNEGDIVHVALPREQLAVWPEKSLLV
jgi:ABC-type Fe3+/spermidine/putrescine transport system ATPase subunit